MLLMKMPFEAMLSSLNPRILFLIDSLGALLSSVMLGLVLVQFEQIIGMPKEVLYYLALAAIVFFLYSFCLFLWFPDNWRGFLRIIAVANLIYCGVTLSLIVFLHTQLTTLGLFYFILEIIVIIVLAMIEWRTSRK